MTRPFLPSARTTTWLLTIGFLAVGYALYMRYLVIEQHAVGLACDDGLATWQCLARKVTISLFEHEVFGWLSLGFAGLNLIRPKVALFALALAFTGLGVVLHNAGMSGVAAGLIVLSLARPVIAAE
jgi:hypothetical protein